VDTKQLLALATAAALPQLAFDAKNIGGQYQPYYGLVSVDTTEIPGINIDARLWGNRPDLTDEEEHAMIQARARYVAAACNAVLPLVQERGLLLEACKRMEKFEERIDRWMSKGNPEPLWLDDFHSEIESLRAAIAQAEGDS